MNFCRVFVQIIRLAALLHVAHQFPSAFPQHARCSALLSGIQSVEFSLAFRNITILRAQIILLKIGECSRQSPAAQRYSKTLPSDNLFPATSARAFVPERQREWGF